MHSSSVVSLSSNLGSNLPSAFLTLTHFLKLIPQTLPSLVLISTGPHPPFTLMPSSSHSVLSSTPIGSSSYPSSAYMYTLSAPALTADLATSAPMLPPPITTTLPLSLPALGSLSSMRATSSSLMILMKSIPDITPLASAPGTSSLPPL